MEDERDELARRESFRRVGAGASAIATGAYQPAIAGLDLTERELETKMHFGEQTINAYYYESLDDTAYVLERNGKPIEPSDRVLEYWACHTTLKDGWNYGGMVGTNFGDLKALPEEMKALKGKLPKLDTAATRTLQAISALKDEGEWEPIVNSVSEASELPNQARSLKRAVTSVNDAYERVEELLMPTYTTVTSLEDDDPLRADRVTNVCNVSDFTLKLERPLRTLDGSLAAAEQTFVAFSKTLDAIENASLPKIANREFAAVDRVSIRYEVELKGMKQRVRGLADVLDPFPIKAEEQYQKYRSQTQQQPPSPNDELALFGGGAALGLGLIGYTLVKFARWLRS